MSSNLLCIINPFFIWVCIMFLFASKRCFINLIMIPRFLSVSECARLPRSGAGSRAAALFLQGAVDSRLFRRGRNMSILDACGNEEIKIQVKDWKPNILLNIGKEKAYSASVNDQLVSPNSVISEGFEENRNLQISNRFLTHSGISGQGMFSADRFSPACHSSGSCAPLGMQFWSAGDYEVQQFVGPSSHNNQNRLCVHPKFLHSNATSHKWVFGAIAELLDNAVDEICNGATFVKLDKIINQRSGSPALLIQDDGGGMDPESLRRCMSFGFSDKQSCSTIGQYGNGFKTSTMRLGADVIVFSRCMNKRVLTQSIGLLSYTFLRQEGYNDVVVPAVDYYFDPSKGVFINILRNGQKQFSSNLSMLLKWSPFLTETELLKNFDDIGHNGTKIIIYNLWFNDMGNMELDFESDEKDIIVSGAPKQVETNNISVTLTQNHIATRLCFSLRAYSSILYLHTPEYFRIILRGQEVEHHSIARDLKFCECIKYKPQVGGRIEGEVITSIGFLKEAPLVNVHGFNIYHKNRLILPFFQVACTSGSWGRGVVGVLEANFIKPTHDKQGFEKSSLFTKLETRLKEMTYEYWEYHSHLVGYTKKISHSTPPLAVVPFPLPLSSGCNIRPIPVNPEFLTDTRRKSSHTLQGISAMGTSHSPKEAIPGQLGTKHNASFIEGLTRKRGYEDFNAAREPLKRQAMMCSTREKAGEQKKGGQTNYKPEWSNCERQCHVQQVKTMMQENNKLRKECLEQEKIQEGLLLKVTRKMKNTHSQLC
ncbi:protein MICRORCHIDIA 6-like isoform X2 [Musa acuminata AAA Group]|uniref:protein MICRORCHIDIA 6-like isoform X2 n=1 Tax=Musa acuminata AAA Group TaxID=214697 RepID=UPI0031DEFEC1